MKALFEHNGFARTEEVPDNPPTTFKIPIIHKPNIWYDASMPTFDNKIEVWDFVLEKILVVDSERVALYKYVGSS